MRKAAERTTLGSVVCSEVLQAAVGVSVQSSRSGSSVLVLRREAGRMMWKAEGGGEKGR